MMIYTRSAAMSTDVLALGMLLILATAGLRAVAVGGQSVTDRVMRFGFSQSIIGEANSRDVLTATTLWTKGLVAQIGEWTTADVTIFKDVNEAVESINTGRSEVVGLSTLEFLSVERWLQAQPGLVYQRSKETTVEYVVLVRSDIPSLAALPGKRLAIHVLAGDWDLSGVWLDVLLGEAGLPPRQKTFSTVKAVTKSSQALMSLFFKQVDVAVETRSAFTTAVELNPQLGKELRILATSPPLLPAVICFSKTIGPGLMQRYIDGIARLHELPQFSQTFLILQVTRLNKFDPRELDTARALLSRREAVNRKAASR